MPPSTPSPAQSARTVSAGTSPMRNSPAPCRCEDLQATGLRHGTGAQVKALNPLAPQRAAASKGQAQLHELVDEDPQRLVARRIQALLPVEPVRQQLTILGHPPPPAPLDRLSPPPRVDDLRGL